MSVGLLELVVLGGICGVFVLPLVGLVVWALIRGRGPGDGKPAGS